MIPSAAHLQLIPTTKQCKICQKVLTNIQVIQGDYFFYCFECFVYTSWSHQTLLSGNRIPPKTIENLISMFAKKKTPGDAALIFKFLSTHVNENTIKRYFRIFNLIALAHYEQQLNSILLEGEVELDESHLVKEKKSFAPHRSYQLSSIWIFGIKKRDSKAKAFVIVPVESRDCATLLPYILKHIKLGTTIYTDSYTVYVNNNKFPRESKLDPYGYPHLFVNHRIQFVSPICKKIHTNGIESLWSDVKKDLRKMNLIKVYSLGIARYFFHKTLKEEEQIQILLKGLQNKSIEELERLYNIEY